MCSQEEKEEEGTFSRRLARKRKSVAAGAALAPLPLSGIGTFTSELKGGAAGGGAPVCLSELIMYQFMRPLGSVVSLIIRNELYHPQHTDEPRGLIEIVKRPPTPRQGSLFAWAVHAIDADDQGRSQ